MNCMRRFAAAAAALGLAAACTPDLRPDRVETEAEAAPGQVALEFAGPNEAALIVPVFINGQGPFSFVLDTGATITCISATLAEELALPRQPGGGIGAGIGGAERVGIVRIDSLRVGDTTAHGMTGCAIDLTQIRRMGAAIDGLVGLNFLREFRVTLDFRNNVASFDPH
jgi:predicted aspartyl protease